jgi:hypothetical protein
VHCGHPIAAFYALDRCNFGCAGARGLGAADLRLILPTTSCPQSRSISSTLELFKHSTIPTRLPAALMCNHLPPTTAPLAASHAQLIPCTSGNVPPPFRSACVLSAVEAICVVSSQHFTADLPGGPRVSAAGGAARWQQVPRIYQGAAGDGEDTEEKAATLRAPRAAPAA